MVKIVMKGQIPPGPSTPVWAKRIPEQVAAKEYKDSLASAVSMMNFRKRMQKQQEMEERQLLSNRIKINRQILKEQTTFDTRMFDFNKRMNRQKFKEQTTFDTKLLEFNKRMSRIRVKEQTDVDTRLFNIRRRYTAQEARELKAAETARLKLETKAENDRLKMETKKQADLSRRRMSWVTQEYRSYDKQQANLTKLQMRWNSSGTQNWLAGMREQQQKAEDLRRRGWIGGRIGQSGSVPPPNGGTGPWGPRNPPPKPPVDVEEAIDFAGILAGYGKPVIVAELLKTLGKTLLNPAYMVSGAMSEAMASGGDYRRFQETFSALGRAGGFSGAGMASSLYGGTGLNPYNIGSGIRVDNQPEWMRSMGLGPSAAMDMLGQYGIPNPNASELLQSLRWAQLSPGFSGMDPNAPIAAARQAQGMGLNDYSVSPERYLAKLSGVLEEAGGKGMDRSTILRSIEGTLSTMEKSGSSGIAVNGMLKLFDALMNSGMPSGMTGSAAQAAMGGFTGAIDRLGTQDSSSIVMYQQMDKYKSGTEEGLRSLIGDDAWRIAQSTPVGQNNIKQYLDAMRGGQKAIALQFLKRLLLNDPTRMQFLAQEGASALGLPAGMGQIAGATLSGNNLDTYNAIRLGGGGRIPETSAGTPAGMAQALAEQNGTAGAASWENNVGNLVATGIPWVGKGSPKSVMTKWGPRSFETFYTPQEGISALEKSIRSQIGVGNDTYAKLFAGTPGHPGFADVNSGDQPVWYANEVAKANGAAANDKIDPNDANAIAGIAYKMTEVEKGYNKFPMNMYYDVAQNGLGRPGENVMRNMPTDLPARADTDLQNLNSSMNNFKELTPVVGGATAALREFTAVVTPLVNLIRELAMGMPNYGQKNYDVTNPLTAPRVHTP